MKLGKLLVAGKSFLSGRVTVAYREDKRVYLPKFNSGKNPFAAKTAEKVPAPAAEPEKVLAAPVLPKTQKVAAFAAPKPAARTVSWAEKLNPFRAPKPAVSFQHNAVQAELSLDAVKVLHNDLSDADVEVVPVKSRTLAPAESPRLLPGRESLEFFGERQLKTI